MPKKKKKKTKTKTKTTERTDDDEATEDKSSSLKAVTKEPNPQKGTTTTTTTTTSSTSLLLSKIVGKHARVCDVALKRMQFHVERKGARDGSHGSRRWYWWCLTDHASSSSSLCHPAVLPTRCLNCSKVMTACQRAKTNTAAKKLLEKWKRLSRVTQAIVPTTTTNATNLAKQQQQQQQQRVAFLSRTRVCDARISALHDEKTRTRQ